MFTRVDDIMNILLTWVGLLVINANAIAIPLEVTKQCIVKSTGAAKIRAQRITQTHNDGGEQRTKLAGFGITMRDLPTATWILVKNPTFLFVTFACASDFLIVGGIVTFLPKFIQSQFGQSDSFSAFLTGKPNVRYQKLWSATELRYYHAR